MRNTTSVYSKPVPAPMIHPRSRACLAEIKPPQNTAKNDITIVASEKADSVNDVNLNNNEMMKLAVRMMAQMETSP